MFFGKLKKSSEVLIRRGCVHEISSEKKEVQWDLSSFWHLCILAHNEFR